MTVPVDDKFLDALADDLNTPLALSRLHQLASMVNRGQKDAQPVLKRSAAMLGLLEGYGYRMVSAIETGGGYQ